MSLPRWCRFDHARTVLWIEVHLQPNARKTEIVGLHGDALKIRVSAPAVEQRANEMLVAFLAERLHVPLSHVHIVRGQKSRAKLVQVSEAAERDVLQHLTALQA
ncbi:MAG TPA: DUF167 domain-containing protein [Burkholderiales bacterium]|nr:DUF167 domain-containing protein [Burkholderiales bacterium]